MADIVNGGIILMVAVFCLVAVVGGAHELREQAGPASSLAGSEGGSAVQATDTGHPVGVALPVKQALDEQGDREGRDGDDGRNHHGKGDDKDDHKDDGDEEDDD